MSQLRHAANEAGLQRVSSEMLRDVWAEQASAYVPAGSENPANAEVVIGSPRGQLMGARLQQYEHTQKSDRIERACRESVASLAAAGGSHHVAARLEQQVGPATKHIDDTAALHLQDSLGCLHGPVHRATAAAVSVLLREQIGDDATATTAELSRLDYDQTEALAEYIQRCSPYDVEGHTYKAHRKPLEFKASLWDMACYTISVGLQQRLADALALELDPYVYVYVPRNIRFNVGFTRGFGNTRAEKQVVKISQVGSTTQQALPALTAGLELVAFDGHMIHGYTLKEVTQLINRRQGKTRYGHDRYWTWSGEFGLTFCDPSMANRLAIRLHCAGDGNSLFGSEEELLDTFDPATSALLSLLPARIVAAIATHASNKLVAGLAANARFKGWTTKSIEYFACGAQVLGPTDTDTFSFSGSVDPPPRTTVLLPGNYKYTDDGTIHHNPYKVLIHRVRTKNYAVAAQPGTVNIIWSPPNGNHSHGGRWRKTLEVRPGSLYGAFLNFQGVNVVTYNPAVDEFVAKEELLDDDDDDDDDGPDMGGCVAAPVPATFDIHLGTLGSEFLQSEAAVLSASRTDAISLVKMLGGSLTPPPQSFSDHELLDETARGALLQLVDEHYYQIKGTGTSADSLDVRLTLSMSRLVMMVGEEAVNRLLAFFGSTQPTALRLRRVEATAGEFVAWHTDFSLRTMQIALNDESEYEGGRLVWATETGTPNLIVSGG
eukprot:COSAG05_NODE_1743_length_4159_cov_3.035961_2_plen_718_part_00